jgi:hypothetical protein
VRRSSTSQVVPLAIDLTKGRPPVRSSDRLNAKEGTMISTPMEFMVHIRATSVLLARTEAVIVGLFNAHASPVVRDICPMPDKCTV